MMGYGWAARFGGSLCMIGSAPVVIDFAVIPIADPSSTCRRPRSGGRVTFPEPATANWASWPVLAIAEIVDGATLMCGRGERTISGPSPVERAGRRAAVFVGVRDDWAAATGRHLATYS